MNYMIDRIHKIRIAWMLVLLLLWVTGCRAVPAQGSLETPTRTANQTPRPTVRSTKRSTLTPTWTLQPSKAPALPTRTAASPPSPSPRAVIAPILLYHHVSDQGSGRYVVAVDNFRRQMETLEEGGYQTVTISQVAAAVRGEAALPERAVAITFDDGYLDTYENAFPILRELGFKATLYVITGTLETDKSYGYLQDEALKELIDAGWEIGSHSVTHTNLKTTWLGIRSELEQSKETLEERLGIEVSSFSYPFGITNDWIKARVPEHGYTSAVGLDILNVHTPRQQFFLSRREVLGGTSLSGFKSLLEPGKADLEILNTATSTPTAQP